jgi:signal transduction histidine kinase
MEKSIIFLNTISAVFLIAALFVLFLKWSKSKSRSVLLIIAAFTILLLVTFTNMLEHAGIAIWIDNYEDFIEILFLPILMFSFFTLSVDLEYQDKLIEKKKLKVIFNQAFSLIGLLDKEGRLLEYNETSVNFLNCKRDEFIGNLFWETPFLTYNETAIKELKNAIGEVQKGNIVRFETTHIDINEQLHYFDFSIKPLLNEDGHLLYMISEGRDITDITLMRKELENHKQNLEIIVKERTEELEVVNEEIRAINEELYQKNEILINSKEELEKTIKALRSAQMQLIESEKMASLGLLTAGIAHEINNPVNFIYSGVAGLKETLLLFEGLIKSYNNLIANSNDKIIKVSLNELNASFNKDENIETIRMLIQHIETGVARTVDIVQSLRYFVRNDSDEFSSINIHELIDTVLIILHNEYQDRISIEKEYNLENPVKCIPGKLNQVLMNIIFNAIQAIPNQGKIEIKTFKTNDKTCILVKDTGQGIPQEIIDRIFDPFFTTKPIGQGTGLGLSIAYKIIEQHKGRIIVNSQPGIGTEFIVELPM